MPKVSTNISIDADLKAEAQELFADLGMDLSTAVNIFLRQAVRDQSIPFEISREKPNSDTVKAIEDTAAGKDMSGPFLSVSSLMEALNA